MNLPIKAYDILEDDSQQSLVRRVNEHLTQGWQPVGGFRQYRNLATNTLTVSQTIVQYANDLYLNLPST